MLPAGETVLEIGSGPGEISAFLSRLGVNCLGTDLSPQMIEQARQYFPHIQFEVQDFFKLTYDAGSFAAVVGFYALVNITPEEVGRVFQEVWRVLKPGGLFMFSFHIFEGQDSAREDDFFDQPGNPLTFYFFKVDDIKQAVEAVGFQTQEVIIRHPYPQGEHPSKRAYLLVNKPKTIKLFNNLQEIP